MKAKSVTMTGALAGLGLVAAYTTWQRPKDTRSSTPTVKVLEASKQSLESVKYEDGQRFLTLKRVDGDLWVTAGFIPGKEPSDAGTSRLPLDGGFGPDGGALDGGFREVPNTPLTITPTRETRANERAETALQKFMPFEATRALGVLSGDIVCFLDADSRAFGAHFANLDTEVAINGSTTADCTFVRGSAFELEVDEAVAVAVVQVVVVALWFSRT